MTTALTTTTTVVSLTARDPDHSKVSDLISLAPRQRALLAGSLILAALAIAFIVWKVALAMSERHAVEAATPVRLYFEAPPFDPAKLSVVDPDALAAVTPETAMETNAARPVSALPNPTARPLAILSADATDSARSLECMTAALYYEAGYESEDGQRAVAQVVLNRLRNPLYPRTVCGVVFQGSERKTGCQFSFTCDGSLARRPSPAIWDRLRRVAASALAGSVYAPVGLSTHYHADYVVPYWAASLVKTLTVGRHIFYRIDGAYGHPGAFNLAYVGREPDVLGRTVNAQLADADASDETPGAPLESSAVLAAARPVLDHRGQILNAGPGIDGGPKSAALAAKPGSADAPKRVASERRWVIGMDGEKAPGANRPAGAMANRGDEEPTAEKTASAGRVALVEPAP